jgi:hypothetical protein
MRQLYVRAYVGEVTGVDYQHLTASDAGEVLESARYGIDRPDGGLTSEGFTELEQEIVASGQGGDIDRRSVGCRRCAGGTGRDGACLMTSRGICWASHLSCLHP